MSKRKKQILAFAAALATAIVLAKGFEAWLDGEIEQRYKADNYTAVINQNVENYTKENGKIILEKAIDNQNVILMGSSELDSTVSQNPMFMFPNTEFPSDITLIGHAYMQSLIHSMKVGTKSFQKADKVAVIVSLQWFEGEDIDRNGFAANFSELNFYDTMNNHAISKGSKKKICKRTQELLESVQGYDDIKVFSMLYASDTLLSKTGLTILKPYYNFKAWSLGLRDKWKVYTLLKESENEVSEEVIKEVDWKEEWKKAEKEGKEACTNNEFYVSDWYYDAYLKDAIKDIKGDSAGVTFESKELGDYELFLQICKENGVEPYLIFMNTNGKYYDYIGIDQEKRTELYDKLKITAEKYGMDYLELSDYEYEPYFMADVMHLGWKGWIKVDEEMAKYYAENE